MITIYTTNTCAYCAHVKKYLEHKGQKYQVINVDDEPEKRQEAIDAAGGAMTVPITLFDHDGTRDVVVGWQPAKLAEAVRRVTPSEV